MSGWEESPSRTTCSSAPTLKRIEDLVQCSCLQFRHLKASEMHLRIHVLWFRSPTYPAHPLKLDQETEHSALRTVVFFHSQVPSSQPVLYWHSFVSFLACLLLIKKTPNHVRWYTSHWTKYHHWEGQVEQLDVPIKYLPAVFYVWKPTASERKPIPCLITQKVENWIVKGEIRIPVTSWKSYGTGGWHLSLPDLSIRRHQECSVPEGHKVFRLRCGNSGLSPDHGRIQYFRGTRCNQTASSISCHLLINTFQTQIKQNPL